MKNVAPPFEKNVWGKNLICVMSTPVSCHIIINLHLLEWLRIGFNDKPGWNIAV